MNEENITITVSLKCIHKLMLFKICELKLAQSGKLHKLEGNWVDHSFTGQQLNHFK